jgi:very-short-patch-repair endonuclease
MGSESDNRCDRSVARLADDEWGVLSLDELRDCGLTERMVDVRLRRGSLHRKYQAVYAVGRSKLSTEGEFLAAVKACGPGARLSHFSCSALLGWVEWDNRRIDVTVCDTTPRVHAGIRVHRTRILEPTDTDSFEGIPVTSRPRTAIDLCSQLRYRAARRAIRQGVSLGDLDIQGLLEIARRQARRPGARMLRLILTGDVVPTRSALEDLVLELIREAGLPAPEINEPIEIAGRTIIPDFRWPDRHLVVEADGAKWHDNKLAREDDAERQALLEANGDRVIRIDWNQAVQLRAQTLARLRSAA